MVRFVICIIGVLIVLALILWGFSEASEDQWDARYMTVVATAYCPCKLCCGQYADGKTSTGTNAYDPGIAVDPSVISYDSRIDCEEYTRKSVWCKPDDCSEPKEKGGKIYGNHIDLRMETHQDALNFGRQKVKIRVWTKK